MALVSIYQIWSVDIPGLDKIILDAKQNPNVDLNTKRIQVSYIYLELGMLKPESVRIITNPHFKEIAMKATTLTELKTAIDRTPKEILGIDFDDSNLTDLLYQYYDNDSKIVTIGITEVDEGGVLQIINLTQKNCRV